MLNGQLHKFTNKELSMYTNKELATLSIIGHIFDRTYGDVDRWKQLRDTGWDNMTDEERQEWLGETLGTPNASKGMYTHNDLNRVESAVEALVARLREHEIYVPNLTIKTDWTHEDKISKEELSRYFSNVETLREYMLVLPTTPNTPTVDKKFDYMKANDLERILYDIRFIVNNLTESWYYSGEIISGEV